jgi:hypothetical protein
VTDWCHVFTGRIQLAVCGHVLFNVSKYSDLAFLVTILCMLKTGNESGVFVRLADINCYQGNVSSGCIDISD